MTRSLILAALALGLLATAAEARSRHNAWDDDDGFYAPPSSYIDLAPTIHSYPPPRDPVVCQTVPVNRFWPEYGATTTCR